MQLKLPRISAEQDEELKGLVLAAEANPTEEIQEKINQVIFSIYDLTDDEIEVVLKR